MATDGGGGGCPVGFYMSLKFIQIVFNIPGVWLFFAFGSPAAESMCWIEIVFASVTVVCLLESILMAFLPICFCTEKPINPLHRFILAMILAALSVGLIFRTVDLDRHAGIPRCQFHWAQGKDSRGRNTSAFTIVMEQPPCQLYWHRMVASVSAFISAGMYFLTGFKRAMVMRRKNAHAPIGGRVFSEPNASYPPQLQQPSVPFPQYNQFANNYSY